jgi:hypothetical protein
MTYTLTKGKTRVQIRFLADTAEVSKTVGGNLDTNKVVLTHQEANRQVNELVREGYKAVKHK